MKLTRYFVLAALAALSAPPADVAAQTFTLDPTSSSLPAILATAGDVLAPGGLTIPAGLPPVVGISAASFGLLPGDVIDAISNPDDGPPGSTLIFSVSRLTLGAAPGPFVPNVSTEVSVPVGIQPEAASDLFTALDPACGVTPPFNTQVVDGDGTPLVVPTCYPGFGMGLAEGLALPGPPLNDNVNAFDWSMPGRAFFDGVGFSLAPGSPTLTPGMNPLLPGGAEPGDLIVSAPGLPPFPPTLFVFAPAASLGLISGGPGCAPPACDDVDALSVSPLAGVAVTFSLAPGSPSIIGCGYSPADVLGGIAPPIAPCAAPFVTAGAIGLLSTDDVNALEAFANPCPVPPGSPLDPDGDGIDNFCGTPDNCPGVFALDQNDSDGDGVGDACDPCTDAGDGDGFGNPGFPNVCPVDLCPYTPSTNDPADADSDGVPDECDNCPLVDIPNQADSDLDGIGDVCDNCPINANVGQADGDLDGVGDDCDICTSGVGMTKPQLKLGKLLAPGADDQLQAAGNLSFPGLTLPTFPLDVLTQGMRMQIVDLGAGSTVLFDHTIPGGAVPNACGLKDGWKTNTPLTSQKFATKTDSIPPMCAAGSALGIAQVQVQDQTAKSKGARFKVKGKNGTYAPAVGPFRITVVLGGAAEGAAGQCAQHTFPALNCLTGGGGKQIKCK